MQEIHAQYVASVTELKKNPMGTVASADGQAVAILNRNVAAFYCVPADRYEALLERLDDLELIEETRAALADGEAPVAMSIEDLRRGVVGKVSHF